MREIMSWKNTMIGVWKSAHLCGGISCYATERPQGVGHARTGVREKGRVVHIFSSHSHKKGGESNHSHHRPEQR